MLPIKNATKEEIQSLIAQSAHKAAKWLEDEATGDVFFWPAEAFQHAEVARAFKIEKYSKGIAVND